MPPITLIFIHLHNNTDLLQFYYKYRLALIKYKLLKKYKNLH